MAARTGARRRQSIAGARRRRDQPSQAFRTGLAWLFSKRLVIEMLCVPTSPAYVRDWVVTRLVDEEDSVYKRPFRGGQDVVAVAGV